jgi:hypothetical protein
MKHVTEGALNTLRPQLLTISLLLHLPRGISVPAFPGQVQLVFFQQVNAAICGKQETTLEIPDDSWGAGPL